MPANDKEAHVPIWFTLSIGGAEAAGFFKEATGFDSESEVTEIKRSLPNGRTDVIKAMGNTKWGDIELKPVVTYSIINAWPKKYTGVGLKADSNEVAVEGITLCHEGFEIK